MNMFKSAGSSSEDEYIMNLSEDRRVIIKYIDKLIRDTVPELNRHFASNMLGYGKFKYTNYKKEELDWPIIALANQKNYISIYVCAIDGNEYIAEKYEDKLGKVSVGKSCIRFKKIEDLDIETLKKVFKFAVGHPGLV